MRRKATDHQYYLKNRERLLLKARGYYEENSETIKERTRQWYQNHKDEPGFKKVTSEYAHKYYLKHRGEKLLYHKERWLKHRMILINYFGGKCERCGFSDYRALQIDHINGGGSREMRNLVILKAPLRYLERIKKNRGEYQLLCANCNWIKKYENKETAKKRIHPQSKS